MSSVFASIPFSKQGEEFRALRSQLMLHWLGSGSGSAHHSIAIMSPARGEGRTHIASNLALVFAQFGQNTLLIDGDLRNPRLHEVFGINNKSGLATALSYGGRVTAQGIPGSPSLAILTAGQIPSNPEELLSLDLFSKFLHFMREKYDVVIIDTPAAENGTDAYIIAARAKEGLIVTRRNVTSGPKLSSLVERASMANAAMLGIVLNEG